MSYERPLRVNPKSLNPPGLKIPPKRPEMDIKSYLNEEMRAQGTAQEANFTGFGTRPSTGPVMQGPAPAPPVAGPLTINQRGVSDTYIYLDSFRKNNANYTAASVQFLTTPLNNSKSIGNVVQIQIGSFYFPRPTWNQPEKATTPDYLYLRRIYLYVNELPNTTTYGTAVGQGFHWEFAVQNINSISVELVPLDPDLYLPAPISNVEQLTLQFLIGPDLAPLILYKDTIIVQYIGGGVFEFLNDTDYSSVSTEYAFDTTGVLATQVGMWITIVEGGVPSVPIGTLTRPQGWFITEMRNSGPNGGFYVADLFALALAPAGLIYTIQLRKNRFAVPMRFSQLENISKNALVPSHT